MPSHSINPSESVVSLASTAGDGATTPTSSTTNLLPKPDAQTSPASSTHASTSSSSLGSHGSRYAPSPRDYEAAFASLSTSYGFSQGHLHVPTKNPKTKKVKAKKDNKDSKGRARDDTADTPNTSPSQSPTTAVGEQGKGSPSTL